MGQILDNDGKLDKTEYHSKEKIIEICQFIKNKFDIEFHGRVLAVAKCGESEYHITFSGMPETNDIDLSDVKVDINCLSMFSLRFNVEDLTIRKKIYYLNYDKYLMKNGKQVMGFGKYTDSDDLTYYLKGDNKKSCADLFFGEKRNIIGLTETKDGEQKIKYY